MWMDAACPACGTGLVGEQETVPCVLLCTACRALLVLDMRVTQTRMTAAEISADPNIPIDIGSTHPDQQINMIRSEHYLRRPTDDEEAHYLKWPGVQAAIARLSEYHARVGNPLWDPGTHFREGDPHTDRDPTQEP